MRERIIDISDLPARLRVRNEQLILERDENGQTSIPLEDLAVVVMSHPQTTLSHAVLSGLSSNGATLVVCDERRRPCAMLLPLEGNSLQAQRFTWQAEAKLPIKKRVWQQLIREKLMNQGRLLHRLRGDEAGLSTLAQRVKSGDPDNLEAQGARRYWSVLQPEEGFTRDPNSEGFNSLLNYGYAILRAIVARAICGAGLHPCLGVHHHNRYNPFCLADDLMEPYRPLVDAAALKVMQTMGTDLNRDTKAALLAPLTGQFHIAGEHRTLFDCLVRTCASLVAIYAGQGKSLTLAQFEWEAADVDLAVQGYVVDRDV